jgi:hypothetical protein
MLLQRINRSSPEKVFVVAKNSYSTASLTNGQVVEWDHQTDADGVGVTKPTANATAHGAAVAGVVAETIAAGSYGLIQVYGYHSAVRCRTISTTANGANGYAAIAAGTPLVQGVTAGFMFEGKDISATNNLHVCGFALAANASYTTKAIAAFIKCL